MACSTRFDEVRAEHPKLGFGVYVLEPHGPVTLEIYAPDGAITSFVSKTLEGALNHAFPPQNETLETDIFS